MMIERRPLRMLSTLALLGGLCLGLAPTTALAQDDDEPYGPHVLRQKMVELAYNESNVVRTGPGETFALVGVYGFGEKFEVIAKSGDWYNIRLSDTDTGWIHASLCKEFDDMSKLEFRPNPRLFSRVGSFSLTGYGGAYSFDRKSNSLVVGGRLAYYLFDYVEVEGGMAWSHIVRPAEIVENLFNLELAEEEFHMLFYAMNVNLKLLPGRQMVPFVTVGVGSTIMQGETESALNWGAGTYLYLTKRVAMRWEFRSHQFDSGLGEARRKNNNVEFSMGTSLLF